MRNVTWYVHRLKAMNPGEILWRIQQKYLQRKEYKKYYIQNLPVTEIPVVSALAALSPDYLRIGLVESCADTALFSSLDLFHGSFSYQQYKKSWNAGFQTEHTWDEDTFSYKINCTGRIDIGDIRTNWELNRHYQFSALAKSYYVSGEASFLNELTDLFQDWNRHNLFLHGVEWTSAMEVAIRVNSWIFTYCFLCMAEKRHGMENRIIDLKRQLLQGILVMADYITAHLSRFSSANNHLIIELYSVAMAGILFDYKQWRNLALKKLTEELIRQNYKDGVNKEMSLHYQTFVMEAYGLLMITMEKNKIKIPDVWYTYLTKMSEFVADCCGDYGETIVFGDNDEGKILDLTGTCFNHYHYVLELMSCILTKNYCKTTGFHENIRWLCSKEKLFQTEKKSAYVSPDVKCYREGGYTLIKDKKRGIFIAIDHADLGYGTLAAHGHADALSFQMYIKGEPIFVDPGSSNYHITPEERDIYRSTYCHNTATIERQNQSEMLGAFLWGRRAVTKLITFKKNTKEVQLEVAVTYAGIIHQRCYCYKEGTLIIEDRFPGKSGKEKQQLFLLGMAASIIEDTKAIVKIKYPNGMIALKNMTENNKTFSNYQYSSTYNHKHEAKRIAYSGTENILCTRVIIE